MVGYVAFFKKIWEKRNKIYFVVFEVFFVILWITEVLTNLAWAYKGKDSICHLNTKEYYYDNLVNTCNAYMASNIVGWMVLLSFAFAAGISWRVHKKERIVENPTRIAAKNNMT
ncbi:5323_t:CDS:2, partial [Diversispora eburnea]